MATAMESLRGWVCVLLVMGLLGLAMPAGAAAAARATDDPGARRLEPPGAGRMLVDLAVARPLGAAITAVGTAAFLVSLPFTVAGGNVGEAGQQLVVGPARETFNRCLGCRNTGWRADYPPED